MCVHVTYSAHAAIWFCRFVMFGTFYHGVQFISQRKPHLPFLASKGAGTDDI